MLVIPSAEEREGSPSQERGGSLAVFAARDDTTVILTAMKLLVLSHHEVEKLLTMGECIRVMEEALADLVRALHLL